MKTPESNWESEFWPATTLIHVPYAHLFPANASLFTKGNPDTWNNYETSFLNINNCIPFKLQQWPGLPEQISARDYVVQYP